MMRSYASVGTEHTGSLIPRQSALEDMIRRPSLFWARATLSSNSSRGRTSIESLRPQLGGQMNPANRRIETDQNDQPSGGLDEDERPGPPPAWLTSKLRW